MSHENVSLKGICDREKSIKSSCEMEKKNRENKTALSTTYTRSYKFHKRFTSSLMIHFDCAPVPGITENHIYQLIKCEYFEMI